MQRYSVCFLATLLLATPACNRSTTAAQDRTEEAYVPVPGSVGFDIELFDSGNGSFRLNANYTSQGRTARFRVEFGPAKTVGDSKDFPMRAGEGRFVAEPGSDASVLLFDLKKALEAKAIPAEVHRLESLPFTFVNIGEDLSRIQLSTARQLDSDETLHRTGRARIAGVPQYQPGNQEGAIFH